MCGRLCCRGLGEQRINKYCRIKWPQVVNTFASPDKAYRNPAIASDARNRAAFGRSVELGQDQSGDAEGLVEGLDLVHCVLTGIGVDD